MRHKTFVRDTRRTATQSVYKPRNSKKTPLWQILSAHFDEFVSVYEDRFESRYGRLSAHVQKVVERYLRCGIPDYGFARIKCADCGRELLLPFSCKYRSFCPSCQKRRQLEFAEFCASEVFAPVPHRQVVLSIPKRIRLHFFRNRKLLSKLARCAWETVRDLLQTAVGRDDVIPGAVAAIQTFGNLADLTPHVHMIVSWGCFDQHGTFYAVREVPDDDILEQVFRHRVFRMLLEEEAVTEELVENMLSWHHSGFSTYVGKPVPATRHGGSRVAGTVHRARRCAGSGEIQLSTRGRVKGINDRITFSFESRRGRHREGLLKEGICGILRVAGVLVPRARIAF